MSINIAFVASGSFIKVSENIARKYKSDKHFIFLYFSGEEYEKSIDRNIISDFYFIDKAIVNSNYVGHNDLPIDENLLNKMSRYESMIYELMERKEVNQNQYAPKTFETRRNLYHKYLRFVYNLMLKNEINLCLLMTIPHEPIAYILYSLCKALNIPVIMMTHFLEASRKYLLQDIDHSKEEIVELYKELKKEYKGKEIDEIHLEKDLQELFDLQIGGKVDANYLKVKDTYAARSKMYIKYIFNTGSISGIKLKLKAIVSRIYEELRFRSLMIYYNKITTAPDFKEKYIFMALQYQPEMTTAPMAGWYHDQILIAEIVAYYMPEDCYLYIKEHPNQNKLHNRSKAYYNQLASIPRVKLIRRDISTFNLQKSAQALVTGTGTVAMECQFKLKPVLVFGGCIHAYAPCSFIIRAREDCMHAMHTIFDRKMDCTLKDVKIFLKCIEKLTFRAQRTRKIEDAAEEDNERLTHEWIKEIEKVINNKR